jgi:hypothetical protein
MKDNPTMVVVKVNPADQRRLEAQVAELIRTGKMPSLEQVQAAIELTRQKFAPLISEARKRREGR